MKYTREQIREIVSYAGFSIASLNSYADVVACFEKCRDIICQLLAENDALREDAERYRLLRRKVCITGGKFHILNLDPRYIAPDAAVELDAAIDAARKKG